MEQNMQQIELFLILVIIVVIYFLKLYINSPAFKGKSLEKKINRTLKKLAIKFGGNEFWDIMIPIGSTTTQIDNILLTEKAIYVIEAKNYRGFIYGTYNQEYWSVTSKNSKTYVSSRGKPYTKTFINKHKFYNPIKQNKTHVDAISNIVKKSIPIISVVVFGSKSSLKKLNLKMNEIVIKIEKLTTTIIKLEESMTRKLNLEEMIQTVEELYYENIISKKERRAHKKNIKQKYK